MTFDYFIEGKVIFKLLTFTYITFQYDNYFQLRIATQPFTAVGHSLSPSLMSHFNVRMRQYDSEFSVLAYAHSQLEVSRPCSFKCLFKGFRFSVFFLFFLEGTNSTRLLDIMIHTLWCNNEGYPNLHTYDPIIKAPKYPSIDLYEETDSGNIR